MITTRRELTERCGEGLFQNFEFTRYARNPCGNGGICGIAAPHRQMCHFHSDLPRPYSQVGQQLVALEDIAEGTHARVQKVSDRIGSKPVGRIGIPVASLNAEQRGVNQSIANGPFQGSIFCLSAGQVPRPLDIIVAVCK